MDLVTQWVRVRGGRNRARLSTMGRDVHFAACAMRPAAINL